MSNVNPMDINFFLNKSEDSISISSKSTTTTSSIGSAAPHHKQQSSARNKLPVSPFMMFCNENRKGVLSSNPNMSFGEISKELGSMWRGLSREEQSHYYDMHRLAKIAYLNEKAEGRGQNV